MIKTVKNNKSIKKISIILVACFIMSVAARFFNIPLNIAAGGVTGFAQILHSLIPSLNIGIIMLVCNIALFILGYFTLGKEFGIYTIIGSLSYSTFVGLLESFVEVNEPILEDTLANLILGSVFMGFGLALVFKQNASTGGTDVIAKILEKQFGMSISKGIFIADAAIIIFAGIIFGIQSGIYALLSLYTSTYVLDAVIAGFRNKIQMTIISSHLDVINQYIQKDIVRGTTLYEAQGGYTRENKLILVTIVGKKQYIKIRNFINSIDDDAFVYISNISEVIGYGFSREQMANVSIRQEAEINN